MSYQTIRYQVQQGVAIITYDRQDKRNAWNVAMYREIVAAIEAANADDSVGAFVITNAGPVFCAGVDFKAPPEPRDPATGRVPNVATLSMAQDTSWLHLLERSKPHVVAVKGAAIGMGATHILPADIRIGSAGSTYAFPFLELGTMPEVGCSAFLPRLVGFGRATDILLTAAKLDAQEALRVGLITRVAADDALLDEAIAIAARMAAFKSLPVKLTRNMIRVNALCNDNNAILAHEMEAFLTLLRAQKRIAPQA